MKYVVVLILMLPAFFCSCSHYYYVPNVQNIPLLKEKNDFRASGSFGGWDESNSIELQSAYAVSNNIGIMANFATVWGGDLSDNDYGRGTHFDVGAGYFNPLKEITEFEIYGGFGVSGQRHEYSSYNYDPLTGINSNQTGNSHLSFIKLFIQPSFGVTYEPFQGAISTRICQVSYTNIEYRTQNESIIDDLNELRGKRHYFIEPALTLRIGGKNLKAQGQISYSIYLNNSRSYFYENAHLTGGLFLNIPAKIK